MIRYLSLFSGIGAFEKALDNLGISYELLAYCEVDKYASKAYSLLHHVPESMNLGDITKVDEKALPTDIDLLTYGFPCQDISIAGNKRGFVNEDGTKTRSGLFFDALRIIEHCKPKVAIAENVKNLTSKSMSSIFAIVLESLDNAGYNCYWQVLNSADYGVPQGRERVFIVSIRKDVDDHSFRFPPVIPLEMCMGDLLDEEVPAEFYLSEEKTQSVIRHDSNHPGHIADRGGRVQPYCQGCALPGFVDSKNEEKTERNAGYLVVSHSGGGMLRQGTRKGIRRTPANRGMRAHRIVKSLDISEDVCHGLCP